MVGDKALGSKSSLSESAAPIAYRSGVSSHNNFSILPLPGSPANWSTYSRGRLAIGVTMPQSYPLPGLSLWCSVDYRASCYKPQLPYHSHGSFKKCLVSLFNFIQFVETLTWWIYGAQPLCTTYSYYSPEPIYLPINTGTPYYFDPEKS